MNRLKNSTGVSGGHPEVSIFLFSLETSIFLPEISGQKCFEMVVNPKFRGKLSKLRVNNPGHLGTETLTSTKIHEIPTEVSKERNTGKFMKFRSKKNNCVHTIFLFRVTYRSEHLFPKDKKLVLPPFGLHLHLWIGRARCPDSNCDAVRRSISCILDSVCISGLMSLFGVTRNPQYTNSLMTLKVLSPKATLYPMSRIVLSFLAATYILTYFC
jgi:hypothetical protein